MPPHRLTVFKIQKYYQKKRRFGAVCSRDNVPVKMLKWSICNKS